MKMKLSYVLVRMVQKEELEVQDVIEEVDEDYDPLLDDLDMMTLHLWKKT